MKMSDFEIVWSELDEIDTETTTQLTNDPGYMDMMEELFSDFYENAETEVIVTMSLSNDTLPCEDDSSPSTAGSTSPRFGSSIPPAHNSQNPGPSGPTIPSSPHPEHYGPRSPHPEPSSPRPEPSLTCHEPSLPCLEPSSPRPEPSLPCHEPSSSCPEPSLPRPGPSSPRPGPSVSPIASTSRCPISSADPPENSRFLNMSHKEVEQFIHNQENKNTLKKTEADIKLLTKFMKETGEKRTLTEIPPAELDPIIADFLVRVRKRDGGDYEPVTLRSIVSSIDRKLRRQKYGSVIMGGKYHNFEGTRNALKAKKVSLKRQGKGNFPNRADAVTDNEVKILYQRGQLGSKTSTWFNNCVNFGLRGVREHYNLMWGDVTLKKSADGTEYVELNERATKTRTGDDLTNVRYVMPKIFADGNGDRDPIYLYKLYDEKRPENCRAEDYPFYIAARTIPHEDAETDTWFRAQRLGEKKISQIMKTMADEADLPKGKKITNTSARKRLVQKLRDSGVEATSIAQISGHKSLQSINNYSGVNEDAHKKISNILSDTGNRPTCSHSAAACSSTSGPAMQHPRPAPVSDLAVQNCPSNAPVVNLPSMDYIKRMIYVQQI